MLVILATWEAEIRSIKVQSHPRQTVLGTPISKITRTKSIGGVETLCLSLKKKKKKN
jgi:hypothetical protein